MLIVLSCATALALGGQSPAEMDEVTLQDGRVMLGHIVEQREDVLVFREVRLGGRITSLHHLPRERIASIREALPVEPPPDPSVASPPQEIITDPRAYLRDVIEEYRVHNLQSAAARLVPLLRQIDGPDLPPLEHMTREALDWSLARFAAEVQLAYSLQRAESGYFRLYYLTPQSLAELRILLGEARDAAMVENVCCGRDADTGTCERLDWIDHWIDRSDAYDGRGRCAALFARHVTRVMGMHRELIRLSRALDRDTERIVALQSDITRLRTLHGAALRGRSLNTRQAGTGAGTR